MDIYKKYCLVELKEIFKESYSIDLLDYNYNRIEKNLDQDEENAFLKLTKNLILKRDEFQIIGIYDILSSTALASTSIELIPKIKNKIELKLKREYGIEASDLFPYFLDRNIDNLMDIESIASLVEDEKWISRYFILLTESIQNERNRRIFLENNEYVGYQALLINNLLSPKEYPYTNCIIPRHWLLVFCKWAENYLRDIEDFIREEHNLPKVGSGWVNQAALYDRIKSFYDNIKVLSEYSPIWLGRQRFDIYIPKYNIAIEYNGKQHYEPVDIFGGEEGFQNTIERDKNKRKLCKRNNCLLIEIRYDEDFNISVEKIINQVDIHVRNFN